MQGQDDIELQNKRKKKYAMLLERSAQFLCEERSYDDHFNYHPINGASILRLHLRYINNGHFDLLFLFPRRPEYKHLYKEVREWFEAEGLEWKDRTVNHERYLGAVIPRKSDEIVRLVRSFQDAIFDYDVLIINSEHSNLINKLTKFPTVPFMIAMVMALGSMCIFPVYQLTQIGLIVPPTLLNISPFEWCLMGIFWVGLIFMRLQTKNFINQNYTFSKMAQEKKHKSIKQFLLILLPPLIASLTG